MMEATIARLAAMVDGESSAATIKQQAVRF